MNELIKKLMEYFKGNESQMRLVITGVSALLILLYLLLAFKPELVWVISSAGRVMKMSSDLKNAKSDVANTDKFKANVDAYKDKVDSYEKRLPMEQEIPTILASLSAMAKTSNVRISGIAPVGVSAKNVQKSAKGQIYREMPIKITAKSGYHELGLFLSNLESADRFMKIVDIDLKSNRVMPKKHDVEMVVSTFILLKD